jgi:DNA-binding transcriptional MerR regulator
MSEKKIPIEKDASDRPEFDLERSLIAEYLRDKGYSLAELKELPEELAESLMKEACRYAAFKLAEIEARSKFRHKIEGPH